MLPILFFFRTGQLGGIVHGMGKRTDRRDFLKAMDNIILLQNELKK